MKTNNLFKLNKDNNIKIHMKENAYLILLEISLKIQYKFQVIKKNIQKIINLIFKIAKN